MGERFIKRLLASVTCNVCGQHYETDDVRIISHEEDSWILKVACSACGTQCLMAAVVKEDRSPELITDLTETEMDNFETVGMVTADDTIDMNRFLRDFDGDFSWLFKPGRA